ncbi:MFS transporter [Sinorhizobium sp. 7-81]|uniref:MFS transporter n=1 Tax=Sinorhizobium sp. 8-89 TaxID=3049089 RepID=UPI0024C34FC2|nr:MFS transporter [Sinorhizobium sp. 8-89]MDK1494248.1 MFS transporter [Sinorhizobium sp. 8-89]
MIPRPWLCLAALSGALGLIGIDMTVLNITLPHLTEQLGASTSEKLWMVNGYSLLMAGLLPGFGALSDRIGHRRMLCTGLVAFGAASFAAAFSTTPFMLIVARAFLGMAAAAIVPAALSIVRTQFLTNAERSMAIAICGAIWSGAAALGPVLGGVLLENFWWGAVFLINVPVIVISVVLSLGWIPRYPANPNRPWDPFASLFLAASLVALIFALKTAFKSNGEWIIPVASAAVGAALMALFVKRQRSTAAPLIDFNMFRVPLFSLGAFVALFIGLAFAALQFALSQELQLFRGLSPAIAGLQLLPIAAASLAAGFLIGPLMGKLGLERLLVLSLSVAALGAGLFTYIGFRSTAPFEMTTLALLGLGIGAVMSVASTAILTNAPEDQSGAAASVEAIFYELGGTIGVAVAGSLMATIYSQVFSAPRSPVLQAAAWEGMDRTAIAAGALDSADRSALLSAAQHAFSAAMDAVLQGITGTILVLCVIVALTFTLRVRKPISQLES